MLFVAQNVDAYDVALIIDPTGLGNEATRDIKESRSCPD